MSDTEKWIAGILAALFFLWLANLPTPDPDIQQELERAFPHRPG